MIKNEECIYDFDSIYEDVRFTTNSYIRLKILATLFEKPQNMKELTDNTHVNYSSVSSTMHDLELKNYVYREHNKYFLTNTAKIRLGNILEFNRMMILLDEFFNIIDEHIVDMIPEKSILEFYLLGKAVLMESSGVDAYRVYDFIENTMNDAESIKCIMPFYYEPFVNILENKISKDFPVELVVPENVFEVIEDKSEISDAFIIGNDEFFLLIVTDKSMILGLFMENGYFDKNRLLTSKNSESIFWAKNLFENFKKENK